MVRVLRFHRVSGRVRVAVRLRPQNAEELVANTDFADCVELQPKLKRLKLRKNGSDSNTHEFDEVLTEFASQKRVYEVVVKPVVEVEQKVAQSSEVIPSKSGKKAETVTIALGSHGLGVIRLKEAFKGPGNLVIKGQEDVKVEPVRPDWWPTEWFLEHEAQQAEG